MKNTILLFTLIIPLFLFSQVREIADPITGKLKERYGYFEDENGSFIKNGKYQSWYSNEMIEKSGNYSKNKKEGFWKFWDKNGNITNEVEYRDGLKHGIYKSYKDKILISIENYVENKLNGEQIEFDTLGNKLRISNYEKGIKMSKWTQFNTDGSINRELNFINGFPKEIFGLWEATNHKSTSFDFKDDGTIIYSYLKHPLNRYASPYVKSKTFVYDMDIQSITITDESLDEMVGLLFINELTEDSLNLKDILSGKEYILIKKQ